MQRKGRSLTGPFLRGAQGGAELQLLHRAFFAQGPFTQGLCPDACPPKTAALHPKTCGAAPKEKAARPWGCAAFS